MTEKAQQPEQVPFTKGQRTLRFAGAAVLTCCALMLVFGYTVLEDRLDSFLGALYWFCCFLLAIIALVIALLDFSFVRRNFKKGKRRLIDEQFRAIEELESSREEKN